jgi:diphosphomevalonate decarboxylase
LIKNHETLKYVATVPTNIALIKYWGKANPKEQWPANDSLSMTLSLYTETEASLLPLTAKDHTFIFAGQQLERESGFAKKIFSHLDFLSKLTNNERKLSISSQNFFPTGCGIASSASGLAALTVAALACWSQSQSLEALAHNSYDLSALSSLARLGSGSACRSLWGGFVLWEKNLSPQQQKASMVYPSQHWSTLCDTVVIFSQEEKSVSSSVGHLQADTSPLFLPRLAAIPDRLHAVQKALQDKNLHALGPVIEEEALDMHAVMMTATPPAVYFTKKVSEFLAWVRNKRREGLFPGYFTMDAGPNVHVLHEWEHRENIWAMLKAFDPSLIYLPAQMGEGVRLTCKP